MNSFGMVLKVLLTTKYRKQSEHGVGILMLLKYNNAHCCISPSEGEVGRLCMSDLLQASGGECENITIDVDRRRVVHPTRITMVLFLVPKQCLGYIET